MSAKLIIHKFEEGENFKTLFINILENENLSETKIGEWHVAKKDINKKKEKEKSRLIIKVVSDENSSILDLDPCAKKLDSLFCYLQKQQPAAENHKELQDRSIDLLFNNKSNHNMITKYIAKENSDVEGEVQHFYNNGGSYIKNPLEYSLEKVRENNAKIMENIHLLNRTLNYTKNKEILGLYNPKTFRSYPCEECGKNFVFETGLQRHYAVRHSNLEGQQRWQVVWTCTECFQVWPKKDLALNHANHCCQRDDADRVQEIKASSVLQCEFCEKVYTNIPRLLRHLKTHTVKNNYECNPCNIAFSCYKTAEQHWLSCLWLKTHYQFSLTKLLLCNACDRKFRNYDQLYNHRYKVEHFIPKLFENDDNNYLPTLVFQCEICGQWFNAINQIQDHKNQFHPQFNIGPL